jgi:hypothetical protein
VGLHFVFEGFIYLSRVAVLGVIESSGSQGMSHPPVIMSHLSVIMSHSVLMTYAPCGLPAHGSARESCSCHRESSRPDDSGSMRSCCARQCR